MQRFFAIVLTSGLVGSFGAGASVVAQDASGTTHERTADGGWSGPCEAWWNESEFTFSAMRVCRVTSYLIRSLTPGLDETADKALANQLFRVCWGTFPKSGGDCTSVNAWAAVRNWITVATDARQRPRGVGPGLRNLRPAVITLSAAETVQSDDELAFLIAHEMGHAVDQYQTSRPSAANEQRADVLAVGFLVKAGYDARSAGRSLQMITGERGGGAAANLLAMLQNHMSQVVTGDTHGFTADRIARMKAVFTNGCAALNNRPLGCKEGWR